MQYRHVLFPWRDPLSAAKELWDIIGIITTLVSNPLHERNALAHRHTCTSVKQVKLLIGLNARSLFKANLNPWHSFNSPNVFLKRIITLRAWLQEAVPEYSDVIECHHKQPVSLPDEFFFSSSSS